MRTRLGVGLMLAGAGAAGIGAVPAAQAAQADVGFMPTGALNYISRGDSARGCAAEGLCGVVGSLQVITGGSSEGGGPGLPAFEIQDEGAAARVQQDSSLRRTSARWRTRRRPSRCCAR